MGYFASLFLHFAAFCGRVGIRAKSQRILCMFFRGVNKHEICIYEKCIESVSYFVVCFAKTFAKYEKRKVYSRPNWDLSQGPPPQKKKKNYLIMPPIGIVREINYWINVNPESWRVLNRGWKKKTHLKFYCGKLLTVAPQLPRKIPTFPPPQEIVCWGARSYQKPVFGFFSEEKRIFRKNINFQKIFYVKFNTKMVSWLFLI